MWVFSFLMSTLQCKKRWRNFISVFGGHLFIHEYPFFRVYGLGFLGFRGDLMSTPLVRRDLMSMIVDLLQPNLALSFCG